MGSIILGVVGTLLGVLIGGALQQMQAKRNRVWQREDLLDDAKRVVYVDYLRSISESYGRAVSHQPSPTEDARLQAAAAEIEILAGSEVSKSAERLKDKVIETHAKIASARGADANAEVAEVDRSRHELIELFKADLGLSPARGLMMR